MTQKWIAVPWENYQQLCKENSQQEGGGEGGGGGGGAEAVRLSAEDLLMSVPKQNRREAAAILNHIEKSPHLSWNEKGELLVENSIVPHTHVSDLLKDAFYNYKHWTPEGVETFYRELAKSNLPASHIKNPERRALLEKYKQAKPPGVLASSWLTWK